MRVLFVALGCEQLSISLLAAILRRRGHQVGLAFSRHLFDDRLFMAVPRLARWFADDDVVEQAIRFRPDVVCFSALTVTYQWMLEKARCVKEACGAVTVFGGVHPSAVPELVAEEDAVDYVCVGEGEVALPTLLDALANGGPAGALPNLVYRRDGGLVRGPILPFFQDLDALPAFEKDLWADHIRIDSFYLTMSSRGCPYRCTYCFNNYFGTLPGPRRQAGRYVRQRSVGHFIAELAEARRRWGVRYVDIEDDIFTLDTAWIIEFGRRYRREVGVPFRCLSHAKFLDEARVKALKEAGCAWVQIGVESADDDYKSLVKRGDKQRHVERALDLLEKARIQVKTDHILGLPGEDDDAQQKALALYARHDIGRIGTFWLCYMPGTEIVKLASASGVLSPADVEKINRGQLDFFYRQGNVNDPQRRRLLAAYELLFRLLPIAPHARVAALDARRIAALPPTMVRAVGLIADTIASLVRRNPELTNYVEQYALGLKNHVRWRLGLPARGFKAQFRRAQRGHGPQPKRQTPNPSCPQSLSGHPGGAAELTDSHGFALQDCGNDEHEICAPRTDFRSGRS